MLRLAHAYFLFKYSVCLGSQCSKLNLKEIKTMRHTNRDFRNLVSHSITLNINYSCKCKGFVITYNYHLAKTAFTFISLVDFIPVSLLQLRGFRRLFSTRKSKTHMGGVS
jgi:hypothetical protein